jgi:hypothetical protein
MAHDNPLRIPERLRHDAEEIFKLTDPFCAAHRRERLESYPMAWTISLDGFIVDARTMPPAVQEEARRRGLIPALPASRTTTGGDTRDR